jgi:hypothetical protein
MLKRRCDPARQRTMDPLAAFLLGIIIGWFVAALLRSS